MNKLEIEKIEVDLLLEAIFQRYGHDFRAYARASVERRIKRFLSKTGYETVSRIIPEILHNESFFKEFLSQFAVTVTEMFRDPPVYRSIRENVVPLLKTYPFIKVWHAGCATGEEVYSLAILLAEEGLYDRATIYATDFNDRALEKAKQGIYPLEYAKEYASNYETAGGTRSFSNYYHADYDAIAIHQSLKKNLTFANHNLATDSAFSETHFIVCRNVLIYFTKALQDRALKLFSDSLVHGGFLCLGKGESIRGSDAAKQFRPIDEKNKIYQKITA